MCWVYPRACGGTRPTHQDNNGKVGLSPRVRGNRAPDGLADGLVGSIPARAGEPPRGSATCAQCAVYPRACGGTHR